jgi:hypothetical protein
MQVRQKPISGQSVVDGSLATVTCIQFISVQMNVGMQTLDQHAGSKLQIIMFN